MAKLAAFTEAKQLSIDDVIAEFRDVSPPEATVTAQKGASVATAGADPELIMADLETLGDVSQAEIGLETHNGTCCPFAAKCGERRRRLPHYRETIPCHWQIWRDVADCPIYRKNGGAK